VNDEWKPGYRHCLAVYNSLGESDQRALDSRARRKAEDRPGGYVQPRDDNPAARHEYEAWLSRQSDDVMACEVGLSMDWAFRFVVREAYEPEVQALRDPRALAKLEAANRTKNAGRGNLLERLAEQLSAKKDAVSVRPLRAAPARAGDAWEEGRE
jgi:hypothetical protein